MVLAGYLLPSGNRTNPPGVTPLFPDQSPYTTFNPFTLQLQGDAQGIGEVLATGR